MEDEVLLLFDLNDLLVLQKTLQDDFALDDRFDCFRRIEFWQN